MKLLVSYLIVQISFQLIFFFYLFVTWLFSRTDNKEKSVLYIYIHIHSTYLVIHVLCFMYVKKIWNWDHEAPLMTHPSLPLALARNQNVLEMKSNCCRIMFTNRRSFLLIHFSKYFHSSGFIDHEHVTLGWGPLVVSCADAGLLPGGRYSQSPADL